MLHQSPHGAPDTCHGGFRLFRAAQEAGVLLNAQHKRTQTKMQPRRGPYGPAERRCRRAVPGPARGREHAVLPPFAGTAHHARLHASRKRTTSRLVRALYTMRKLKQPRRGPYGPAGAAELQGMKSGGAATRCPARRGEPLPVRRRRKPKLKKRRLPRCQRKPGPRFARCFAAHTRRHCKCLW